MSFPERMTVKDKIKSIVHNQPDDSSFDEILQELSFARMIERGLGDIDAGRVTSHKEMKKEIASWRK